MQSVVKLSVIYGECHNKAHYAECRYAEYCYAECRYAECHYAECRYAECRGAVLTSAFVLEVFLAEIAVVLLVTSSENFFSTLLKVAQLSGAPLWVGSWLCL
jgi:hypothetical protein